jgi:arylsulfatase A-like enzyme
MAPGNHPRRGFDHWVSFDGQGVYVDPVLNVNGEEIRESGYTTDLLTDYALEWLRGIPVEQPVALFLWHKAPHAVFVPAPRHEARFEGEEFPEPPNYRDSYRLKPEWYRRGMLYGLHEEEWNASLDEPVPDAVPVLREFGGAVQSESFRDYLRTLLAVDESTGRLLDELDASGRRENALILYTSDNGFNLSAHQSPIDKRNMWEESIRIPLWIDFPGDKLAGRTESAMVLNVDFVPTFLAAAGVELPGELDGRPLQALQEGSPEDWRDSFYYRYEREDFAPGIVTMHGVRTDRYKFILYPETEGGAGELFDLRADPWEMRNVLDDPAYEDVRVRMEAELDRKMREVDARLSR